MVTHSILSRIARFFLSRTSNGEKSVLTSSMGCSPLPSTMGTAYFSQEILPEKSPCTTHQAPSGSHQRQKPSDLNVKNLPPPIMGYMRLSPENLVLDLTGEDRAVCSTYLSMKQLSDSEISLTIVCDCGQAHKYRL